MKILIDNGHGSNTPGKCSPDGRLREYSYTREIAGRVVFELRKLGIDAELVVKEEIDVPLSERCRRVNEYKTSEAILISIHCNAAGNGSNWMQARGWEAWTSVGQTKADKLADCLYATAEEYLFGMKIRKDMAERKAGTAAYTDGTDRLSGQKRTDRAIPGESGRSLYGKKNLQHPGKSQ